MTNDARPADPARVSRHEWVVGTAETLTTISVTTDRQEDPDTGEYMPVLPEGTIGLDVWEEGNPTSTTLHAGQARTIADALRRAADEVEAS